MYIKIIAISTISLTLLSACSSTLPNVNKPNLSEEKIKEYQQIIEDNENILEEDGLTDEAKYEALANVAVTNDNLGNYDEAVKSYEKMLEINPSDFLALNNLSTLYERITDYEKAAYYVKFLHKYYKDRQGVISDVIRILVENNEFENAKLVITEYAQNYSTPESAEFISEQFDYIMRMSQKAAAEDSK